MGWGCQVGVVRLLRLVVGVVRLGSLGWSTQVIGVVGCWGGGRGIWVGVVGVFVLGLLAGGTQVVGVVVVVVGLLVVGVVVGGLVWGIWAGVVGWGYSGCWGCWVGGWGVGLGWTSLGG